MERILLHGVPYYIDKASKLYTYQESPVEIGSYTKETDVVILKPVTDGLKEQLEHWRSSLTAKPRKAVSGGTSDSGRQESESSEEDDSD